MAKVKTKFKNLILLLLLLVVWTLIGLLGKVISNKTSLFSAKEAQAVCCGCLPIIEGCDGCEGCEGSIEGSEVCCSTTVGSSC